MHYQNIYIYIYIYITVTIFIESETTQRILGYEELKVAIHLC